MKHRLPESLEGRLRDLALLLVDQHRAKVVVAANEPRSGFWFGGGNMLAGRNGVLYLVGRFRNAGDSRTGLEAGQRGAELAIFRSDDRGASFMKILSFDKNSIAPVGHRAVSIEGSAICQSDRGIELFVSSEKLTLNYPTDVANYQKAGTGVWSIDHLEAGSIEGLANAPSHTLIESREPAFLHVKDPFVRFGSHGELELGFCSHPFSWTSSNTARCVRNSQGELAPAEFEIFPRGATWDVAMSRGTCVLDIPRLGCFRELSASLLFYDGGECVRKLDEHASAVHRPRGYSCEELGGVAYMVDHHWETLTRLSRYQPLFVSPWGTGASRYVDVLATEDRLLASWQQSQTDFSQPLVMNAVGMDDVARVLS